MRTANSRRLPSLCLLASLIPCLTSGQPAEESPVGGHTRPVVGLVLSGGGARGGAHIGVLKALEELRVPVDLVAGTSIGAAVGGFYASGMSPADLEAFVSSVDWTAAFANSTPRELRSFRRKRDDDLFLVRQKPGLNNGEFELPVGVVQGQVIDMILSRITLPVARIHDFDDLARPFRAVAGDLATGEAVVLASGDLALAIRASMSVPAAIAPIEIDGRLLVDGGIAMNLPIEVAKDMGAEVVIAVDVSADLASRDELNSLVDVTGQLTNLLTRRGIEKQYALLTDRDVLLAPEISDDFSSVNFARISETIQAGYDLVMQRRDDFAGLALSEAAYAAYRAALRDPRDETRPVIDFVRLDNPTRIADSVIEKRLSDIEVGQPLNLDTVERAINRVYGLEYYQNVRYELVESGDQTGLEIELQERTWGPNYLQFGLSYMSASQEDSLFGVAASYLRTEINELGGEWRATLELGDEPAFDFDFYQPLGPEAMFFVEPLLHVGSRIVNYFEGDSIAAELNVRELGAEIAGGRDVGSWGEARAGLRAGTGSTRLRVGDPAAVPYDDFDLGEFFARFSVDTLDDVAFPRRGLYATAEWLGSRQGTLSADATFDQLLTELFYAKTWGRHTLLATLRYDTTISGRAPIYSQFQIGGFLDLSGLNRKQLTGQNVARIGGSYYRRIGDLAFFPAFAGISLELGNAWDERSQIDIESARLGGSFWAGIDTPIGPVYLAYGLSEGGEDAFYVVLGRIF